MSESLLTEPMTLAAAAKRSGLCVKTLRRAIKRKKLKCLQPNGKGGKILVTPEQLTAWLASGSSPSFEPVVSSRLPVRPFYSERYGV